ncbi:DUF1853 family protein [Maribacter sp. CXY002]|uniref:DUF1853 family protein n=1 Tax=Maribacter luteocoastalis TaxID=3407671 RepID=UPI003B6761CA
MMTDKRFSGFLETPPLWTRVQFGIPQFELPELDLSTFVPQAIPERLRLGHQMEYVFHQLLSHSGHYDILLHNLPVRKGKQTLGEIDFIIRSKTTEQLVHIELTYKFYIIDTNISEPIHQLMGPNKRDMFFTKMEKIKNVQFQLLHSKEGRETLLQNHINSTEITHETCYKAQLFMPYGDTSVHIRPLNKHCVTGYWLRFNSFNTSEFKAHTYYIPYKTEWVVAPHGNVQWTNHFETCMEINLRLVKENAPMVWLRKSETEFEKFFVVWW